MLPHGWFSFASFLNALCSLPLLKANQPSHPSCPEKPEKPRKAPESPASYSDTLRIGLNPRTRPQGSSNHNAVDYEGNDREEDSRRMAFPPVPISPAKLFDVADRLGAIEAVKRKLIAQPDPAAAQLVTVLEELSKIYGAMEDELTTYLSLFFAESEQKQLAHERAALARLEAGAIRARMSEARGRCGKIWNIYVRYLTPWFQRVLNPHESEHVSELFRELSEVDSHMVDAIAEIADWLTEEAKATLDLVEQNNYEDANARVVAARRVVRPMRERIADSMIRIRRIESDFIEISGAV